MSSSPSNDDEFVTITTKHRKKQPQVATPGEGTSTKPPTVSNDASTSSSSTISSNISLRPRTMFAMKGRGRTESEGSAYRPQWSKDGEGFVSASSSGPSPFKDATIGSGQSDEHRGDRRKAKVFRYTKEELLALHSTSTKMPKLPPETTVASEHSLPPVSTLPFDYDEIYKQWSLNRSRGRGRGRGNAPPGVQSNARGHLERGSRGEDGDGVKAQREDHHRHSERDSTWERGTKITEGSHGNEAWDEVLEQDDSNEMDLFSMAEAAEKFRREMDAMKEELQGPKINTDEIQEDLDAFDKKLEDAAATGQFEDSDTEDGQWDDPASEGVQVDASSSKGSLENLMATPLSRESNDSLVFSALEPADKQVGLEEKSGLLLSSMPDNKLLAGLSSLRLEVIDEWFYLDPQGLQQGPFKSAEMREWFEAGYFKPHLPIRFGREGIFTALASQFAPGQVPFAAPLPRLNDLRGMSAEPCQSEQQRLLEIQREQQHQQQQQQQQQMIQLQQQQQRMLQLDQEEKLRMELQRLEIARQQQQTQVFQQQQMLRHQQEQQRQQELQQQQMLMQQQNSWQRSQREGIMSALGLFGESSKDSIGVNDAFRKDGMSPYHSEICPQHQLNLQDTPSLGQNSLFIGHEAQRRDQAFWPNHSLEIANNGNAADTSEGLHLVQLSSPALVEPSPQLKPRSPAAELGVDAWRTSPISSERLSPTLYDIQNEEKRRAAQESCRLNDQDSSQQEKPKAALSGKANKDFQANKRHEKKTDPSPSRNSEKSTKVENNAWAAGSISATAPITSKSLKDIQKEEQRKMLHQMSSNNGDDKSLAQMGVQLKMMLGVNSVTMNQSTSSSVALSPARNPTAPTSLSVTPVASAWGTPAAATTSSDSKSMRDILAEEERLALERAKANENAPTSSHWMNIVAGNKVAAPVIPKPARSVLGPVPASVLKSRQQARAVNGAAKPAVSKAESDASFWNFGAAQSADRESVFSNVPTGSSNAFGKKNVSSEFMGWAVKQFQTINSNADGTLLEYLVSVEDPGEIREYLAAYLGSTPRVSAFATEFIQRKKSQNGGNKSPSQQSAQQRAFETGSSNKRGKRRLKSHKIDPSLLNYSVGS